MFSHLFKKLLVSCLLLMATTTVWADTLPIETDTTVHNQRQFTLLFTLTDGCNDGYQINFRFFSQDRDAIWPGRKSHYNTERYNKSVWKKLNCVKGERICYGAQSGEKGERQWGVGLNGRNRCENCCYTCDGTSVKRRLSCPATN